MAATDLERLIVQVEANSTQLTKELAKLTGGVDSAMNKVERRTAAMSQRVTAGFGRGITALAGRFFALGTAIRALSRIADEAARTNDEVRLSVERMNQAYARLGDSAGPGIAFVNNRLADLLDSVNNVVTALQRAGSEIKNSPLLGGKGGINIPIAPNPFTTTATIDPTTKNVIPAPGGFAVPGVTDVTPQHDKELEAALAFADELGKINRDIQADRIEKEVETQERLLQDALEFGDQLGETYRQIAADRIQTEQDTQQRLLEDALKFSDELSEQLRQASVDRIQDQLDLDRKANEDRVRNLDDTLSTIATLSSNSNDTLAAIGKAAALAQATIDGIAAVQKALASAPPPFNFALAAAVGVATAANVARIAAMAQGGIVGPGGEMPLRRYARGGVASSPQMALFGEGSMNEAFVPLPDGRRIPVSLKMPSLPPSSSSSNSLSNVFHIDARGAQQGVAEQLEKTLDVWHTRVIRDVNRRLPDMMVRADRRKL